MVWGAFSAFECEENKRIDHWHPNLNPPPPPPPLCPLLVKNEEVEQVDTYKYLGVTIDDKLNWNAHAKTVLKKLNSRLYFLRKLNLFHVEKMLLSLFYKTMLESIMLGR